MKQQKILLYYIHVCTLISLQIYILRDHNIHKCLGQLGCFHNNLISTSVKEKRSNHTDFDHGIYDNLLFRSKKTKMSLSHGQLLVHCIRVLDSYNSDTQSVEEHVNKYLKNNQVRAGVHSQV